MNMEVFIAVAWHQFDHYRQIQPVLYGMSRIFHLMLHLKQFK